MGFQKVIDLSSVGQLTISEKGGVATLKLGIADKVGGGSVEGFASAHVNAEINFSAIQLIDAGMGLLKEKFPTAAPIIANIQAIIDAELTQL